MGLYELLLSMSLLGFGMGTMLDNVYICGIMLLFIEVLNILVRIAITMGHMCFRCLMLSLSRPCELLFLLCLLLL